MKERERIRIECDVVETSKYTATVTSAPGLDIEGLSAEADTYEEAKRLLTQLCLKVTGKEIHSVD